MTLNLPTCTLGAMNIDNNNRTDSYDGPPISLIFIQIYVMVQLYIHTHAYVFAIVKQ